MREMEEMGAQVAPPIFVHQQLASGFCEGPLHSVAKKRALPYQGSGFQQHQQAQFQNPGGHWNANVWDWDSVRFAAKPLVMDVLRPGTARTALSEQQGRADKESSSLPVTLNSCLAREEDESLSLKLGGGGGGSGSGYGSGSSTNSVEETVSRPVKRVRSGSPGGGSYPMCQVDDCREDLSNAKDYHRRHKVCEGHSKSSKALVGKQMQRFCQQCSRFHPLAEFDEGKRSCRRRLAGHNRRRRKTQTEDTSSRILLPVNHENTAAGNLDIVNLLTVLAGAQGNNEERSISCSTAPSKDQLIQILSKINSLPLPVDLEAKSTVSGSLTGIVPNQVSSDNCRLKSSASSPSTMDLLAVLSAKLAASGAILSQRSIQGSDAEKSKSAYPDQALSLNMQKGPASLLPSAGGERSSSSYQFPVEDASSEFQRKQSNLPFQLFSSSPEGDSPPKMASGRQYFSSDSSNPMEDSSPSSSPPVVQKLFPMHTCRETEPGRVSTSQEVYAKVEKGRAHRGNTSLDLFGSSAKCADNGLFQSLSYRVEHTMSSGSDHSPSSLSSDSQDRTGRIIFKLFDKDPSHLPGSLRTQIINWLSHSPSDMEGYIRPGCVVLSIYVSMSSSAWEQLEENLLQRINSLIHDSDTDFWRNGRFLVRTGKQLASHKNGKIRLCKCWQTLHSPDLFYVSPLAIIGGKETSLLLRGRNLNAPGTKIHCTHMGGYSSKEVLESTTLETLQDELSSVSFTFNGEASGVLGRCFVEVENGFKGTSFPVIIADAAICQELRILEFEFAEDRTVHDPVLKGHVDVGRPRSNEEVLRFLNELGWLFQKKQNSYTLGVTGYTVSRFKFLLVFSVERNCCALVKTLLDILLGGNLIGDVLLRVSLEMLSEIHLLNRAVKRKYKNMIYLLIHYSAPSSNDTSEYIFLPNQAGPGGITPLHLAACMSSSDDVVDALTSDPQEIGLCCWNSLPDGNGHTPYAYALMRNNHSYNRLVAQKLADRENSQVSVPIENEIDQQYLTMNQKHEPRPQFKQGRVSCSRCAAVASRYKSMPGAHGLVHRPYIHSMLAIAAVCVCVCLFLRGSPDIGLVAPFKWENLGYGFV